MADIAHQQVGRRQQIWLFIQTILGWISAGLLVTMMCLTGADVIARYLFNAPIKGAFELTEILLALLIFAAMPLTTGLGQHIEVALFDTKNRATKRYLTIFAKACAVLVFSLLAFEIWGHGARLARYGQVTNSLEIPLSLIAYLVAGFCALSVLVLIIAKKPKP